MLYPFRNTLSIMFHDQNVLKCGDPPECCLIWGIPFLSNAFFYDIKWLWHSITVHAALFRPCSGRALAVWKCYETLAWRKISGAGDHLGKLTELLLNHTIRTKPYCLNHTTNQENKHLKACFGGMHFVNLILMRLEMMSFSTSFIGPLIRFGTGYSTWAKGMCIWMANF